MSRLAAPERSAHIEDAARLSPPLHPQAQKRKSLFPILLVIAFLAIGAYGAANHELWRDEVNTWLISYYAKSPHKFFSILQREGHPCLWYLCLAGLRTTFQFFSSMQILHLLIAAASVWLIATYSRFSTLQKVLFAFGYFPAYEYALICRGYALGNLLLFAFCSLFSRQSRNYPLFFLILSLVANTSVYGTIIAIACACGLVAEAVIARGKSGSTGASPSSFTGDVSRPPEHWTRRLPGMLSGISLFALAVLAAAVQMMPPPDGFHGDWPVNTNLISRVEKALLAICIGYFPVPNFGIHFWSTSPFTSVFPPPLPYVVLSVALFAVFCAALIRRAPALITYTVGTLGTVAFTFLIFQGTIRHFGELFILLVSSLWIAQFCPQLGFGKPKFDKVADQFARFGNLVFTGILAVSSIIFVYAYSMDLRFPFTQGRAVSTYLRQQKTQLGDIRPVVYPTFIRAHLSFSMHKRAIVMQIPRCKSMEEFHQKVFAQLIELASTNDGKVLFLSPIDLPNKCSQLEITQLKNFGDCIIADENTRIYLVKYIGPARASTSLPHKPSGVLSSPLD